MPIFVDPDTGEHFDNDAEDADARAAQVGLVPQAQYEADNRPFLESAAEGVQAVGNTLLRPLEALGNAIPSDGSSDVNRRVADTWSPSSEDARRIAQEHPIASALPLAGEALLPGGPLVQMAAGTLGSAAEGTFQKGGQYGEIDPDELMAAAALGAGGAAVAPALKGLRGLGDAAVETAGAGAKTLLGKAGRAAASGLGREFTQDAVADAVGSALHSGGVIAGAAAGGLPGAFVGGYAGRRLNRKYGEKIVDAIYGVAKGADRAGLGVARAGSAAEQAAAAATVPIDPEAVAMGTGFGPIFRKAEDAMSPALQRAKAILARREQQGGHTVLGANGRHGLAPENFPSVRALDEEQLHQSIAALPEYGWSKPGDTSSYSMHGVNLPRAVRDKLTAHSDEIYAEMSQPERDAIDAYTGGEYQNLRAIQKGQDPEAWAYDAKHESALRTKAADLDTAVDKISIDNPTQHGPLYRGLPATPEMLDELMRHDEFVTSASTSSSYSPGMAIGFAGSKPTNSVLIKFDHVEHGAPLFGEAGMGESEVLLPRGAKYKVTGRHRTEDGELLVTVKQVGKASPDEMRDLGALGSVNFTPGKPGRTLGPNFTLGDVAKSPIGLVTGVGAAVGVGNVLARAERKANEAVDFEDLKDMNPDDRQAAIVANGPRYAQQATEQAANALEDKTAAYVAAKDSARKRIGEITAKPSDAQRAYADVALNAIDSASQSLRGAGDIEASDKLDDVSDQLTEPAVAHQQKLPVTHDSGELLSQLDHAYDVLRSRDQLPTDAQVALDELKQGTTRPELWGQAGDMLADLRHADDAVDQHNISDMSDPDTWRQNLAEHIAGARHQVDVLDKWGVDTEKLTSKLDKLSDALDRGESVAAELSAAGVRASDQRADPHDQGPAAQLGSAVSQEFGAPVNLDEALAPSMRQALGDQQKAYRYDTALRSVQRGAEVSLKKAARGMAGLGSASDKVEPDASNVAFTSGYSDEQAAFEARRSMIEQLGKNPMALADSMASSYGDLVKTHPEVYDQITSMVTRATDILTQAMPPSMLQSIQHPNGLPPSIDDVRAFSRVYMAVIEPETYLRDLGAGQAWPEQSQAFAKMYPQQWTQLSQEALTAATERGPRLSPQEATYLDITFNVGNNLGGMWSDKGAQAIRNANTARAQANQQKAKSLGQTKPAATAPNPATAALSAGPSSTPVS